MTDRRGAARIPLDVEVRVESASATLEGRVEDASSSGVFIRTSSVEPPGEPVRLALALPDDAPPVRAEGIVARVGAGEGGGLGIRLVDMGTDDRRRLANFLLARQCETERGEEPSGSADSAPR